MKSLSENILTPEFNTAGTNLIEASAGTGKTYSIQTLFLRLVITEGIPVQKILVVTFTEAATKELRERLRSIMEKCRLSSSLESDDPDKKRIKGILALELTPNHIPAIYADKPKEVIQMHRIKRALLDFDQAAINTIHGFCQRSLKEFAFECSYDFDTELVNNDTRLQQLCNDWWRRVKYSNPTTLSENIFKNNITEPEKLLNLVKAIAKRPMAEVYPSADSKPDEAESSIKETITATITYLNKELEIITADINSTNSAKYFNTTSKQIILEQIKVLSRTPAPSDLIAFDSLLILNSKLRPTGIANDYIESNQIKCCITACKKCSQLIKDYKIGVSGGSWKLDSNISNEWAEALTKVKSVINENYNELEIFLNEEMEFYTKNSFDDPNKKEKLLDALKELSAATITKTAINQISSLKQRKSLPWNCSSETAELLKKTKPLIISENTLLFIEQATGVKAVLDQYNKDKHNAHEMTYDDMLQRLQQALAGDQTNALTDVMREKYDVALIDEFQDTDPVQYSIFNEIFAKGKLPFFYVGDPKQAIYSFRGGDVFTYSQAVDSVNQDNSYYLDTNYRSQAPLITAINTIFMDREGQVSVFGEKISYSNELKCNDLKSRFIDNNRLDKTPLKIWKYINRTNSKITSYSSHEARAVYTNVAEEIVRLLNSKDTGFSEYNLETDECSNYITHVQPSDIAILVRRHAEAKYIYQELQKRGVPVVRQAGDNVFDSSEALELLYLIKAMVNPENISAVRTALASELLPISDQEVVAIMGNNKAPYLTAAKLGIEQLPDSLDKWIALFKESKELWLSKDFSSAFSLLTREAGIDATLASAPGGLGERRLVTVKQLHDLTHQNAIELHLGPEGVVKWFARQLNSETREENDAFETRLESDADAVRIMTIFKSKGLEFPIVFIPTMWTAPVGKGMNPCLVYHEKENTIINLNKDDKDGKRSATAEKAEEDIRNLYVAVTRGSYRTYIIAGGLGADKSTLDICIPDELLNKWNEKADNENKGIEIIEKELMKNYSIETFTRKETDSNSTLEVKKAKVDISRRHASFSSISPHGHVAPITIDSRDIDAADAETEQETTSTAPILDIFTFPAGAHTGECWHSIFEFLDFMSSDKAIKEMVNKQLSLARLDKGDDETAETKRSITANMVKSVLNAELHVADKKTVKLAEITEKQKLAEMSFDFSLSQSGDEYTKNAVWNVLNKHWGNSTGENKLFLERLKNWETTIPGGFMTGFIDLLFEQDGKYYILDWKSNRLNGKPEGFDRDGLASEIANHSYFLQYLIYTVAVHRFLGQCIKDYDYDKHFGGALYIFLRGVNQNINKNSQHGIYYTKPEKNLIEDLSTALSGLEKGDC